jgi:hypothetical protein
VQSLQEHPQTGRFGGKRSVVLPASGQGLYSSRCCNLQRPHIWKLFYTFNRTDSLGLYLILFYIL